MRKKQHWLAFNGLTVNLDNVVSFCNQDKDKIRIFFASGTNLNSTDVCYSDEETRNQAFQDINTYLSKLK